MVARSRSTLTSIQSCIQTASVAGCPRDQIIHFIKSGIDSCLGLEYDIIGVEESTTLTCRKYLQSPKPEACQQLAGGRGATRRHHRITVPFPIASWRDASIFNPLPFPRPEYGAVHLKIFFNKFAHKYIYSFDLHSNGWASYY
jgi:hypothetical protein